MSEIEDKRKELENTKSSSFPSRMFKEGRIEGFNLGVEMARKEHLKIFENWMEINALYCTDEEWKELKASFNSPQNSKQDSLVSSADTQAPSTKLNGVVKDAVSRKRVTSERGAPSFEKQSGILDIKDKTRETQSQDETSKQKPLNKHPDPRKGQEGKG